MAEQPKLTIVAATGTAGGGAPGAEAIQQAMAEAVQKAIEEGVTDPDEIRKRQLEARAKVKAGLL